MIISVNPEPNQNEFDLLLHSSIIELNSRVNTSSTTLSLLSGNKLEPYVKEVISNLAIGTSFENSIELIGGQKFPDIIAKKYYGIEVKTTTQNHWKTTGNSILENTRVENVERIFMLFAKLANPIEFRCRPYEECLAEIVVTHSPRYLIDMNLKQGETIFDKIQIPYDTLRKKDNPIKPIIEYYKKKLKPGEDLWWIDQNNGKASNIVIKIWNNLTIKEKQEVKIKAMIYFPELFSNSNDKFGRFAIWLVTREGIVCSNIRDLFTAGGRLDRKIGKETICNIPRVFINLFDNIKLIIKTIKQISSSELSEYWGVKTSEEDKISDWIELVYDQSKKISEAKHLNIKQILSELLNS